MELKKAIDVANLMVERKKLLDDSEKLRIPNMQIKVSIFLKNSMWLNDERINYTHYKITEEELREFLLAKIDKRIDDIEKEVKTIDNE